MIQTKTQTYKLAGAVGDENALAISLSGEGKQDEARSVLQSAIGQSSSEERIALTLTLAMIERKDGKPRKALSVLRNIAGLVESLDNRTLKGKFYNGLGISHEMLRQTDQALIEYTAASYHHEQAGNLELHAQIENNIAVVLLDAKRPFDAHKHLDRAEKVITDEIGLAQVEETRARAFLAENRISEAFRYAALSAARLALMGEPVLLDESIFAVHNCVELLMPEEKRIRYALEKSEGHIKRAAQMLGMSHQTLSYKVDSLGIKRRKLKPRGKVS